MNPLPKLYVEGKNDLHVIANLMKMRGVELDVRRGPVVIEACDSYVELLESLKVATKANLQRCGVVGFVFDTDREEDHRYPIPADNPLLPMADRYVDEVSCSVESSKRFKAIDKEKAQMASWLAVQPVPGLPYGSAIAAELLHSRAPLADSLFGWVCRLYDLHPSTVSEGVRHSTHLSTSST